MNKEQEDLNGYQILDGSIDNAYQQLASAIVIRAARDYQHYLLRPDISGELEIASDLNDISAAAKKAITKRLTKDPSAVDECKRFLASIIEDGEAACKNKNWVKSAKKAQAFMENAKTAEDVLEAAHMYRMACSCHRKFTKKFYERQVEELVYCERFLKDGRVEFYSNGLIDSEALMALIEERVEAENRRRERKRKREQGVNHQ